MAEGTGQGPEINSSTTQGLPGQKGPEGLPGQVAVPVERRPWSVSPGFDAARTGEYLRTEDGGYTVFTDPKTGKEVARVLKAAGGRPPEGPRGPEPSYGPEWEMSPERGRWLVEEFILYRLTMPYEVRYNAENGPKFRETCQEINRYVDAWIKIRNDPDPFGPHKAYPKPSSRKPGEPLDYNLPKFPAKPDALETLSKAIAELHDQFIIEQPDQPTQPQYEYEALPIDPNDPEGKSFAVEVFKAQYDRPSSQQELLAARAQLDVYFRQAKRNGLLQEVDVVLDKLHANLTREGLSENDIQVLKRNGIAEATEAAIGELRDKMMEGINVEPFYGVASAYIDMAIRTMDRSLREQPEPGRGEGEWSIPDAERTRKGTKETYWVTTSWAKYYQITAENEEQFLIAKDTFFTMIRSAGLGKSPEAVYEHVQNFIEMFKQAGGRKVQEGKISDSFLLENRLELEALLYVFVGNYSNEVYNHKQRKDAMLTMSRDEGPARWAAIYRSGKGAVASFTRIFDIEALMDIYMNSAGERGELTIKSGHFVQDMIQEIVTERGMGVVLKDYDYREEYLGSGDLEAKIRAAAELERIKADLARYQRGIRGHNLQLNEDVMEAKLEEGVIEIKNGRIRLREGYTAEGLLSERDRQRLNAFKANLGRLGLIDRPEEFKALYEGFDLGDTHIRNYQQYREDQTKPPDQRRFPAINAKDDKGRYLIPESIRKSIDLGRIQLEIQAIRDKIIGGEIPVPPRGKRAVDLLKDPRDRQLYQAAFAEAAANFDIAFQMQGVLGEKGRRGRGFLYVNRNSHIRYFFEVADRLRIEEGIDIHGIDKSNFEKMWEKIPADKKRSFKLGYMLSKIRDGKQFSDFSKDWQDFYNSGGFSNADREDFVDHLPVYQAENFVQWGVFWTKMKYADDSPVWNEERNGKKGYKEWDDEISMAIRNRNKNDKKGEFENFKAMYRKAQATAARNRLIDELRKNGYQAQLTSDEIGPDGKRKIMTYKRPRTFGYTQSGKPVIYLDQDNKPIGLTESDLDENGKVIIFNKPYEVMAHGKVVKDGEQKRLNFEDMISKASLTKRHDGTFVCIEEAAATYQLAALSDDFRNRYTDHTYWYYQGNNRDTIIAKPILEGAKRIRDGFSRPEDEDILSVQLLIVDPTLCRVREFPEHQKQRETTLIAAAVLESFQGKQRTRHALHRRFLPRDGNEGRMQAGYRNEDWAGYDRFTMGFEEFAAQQPLRLARRAAAWIANVPLEHDSASARWGVHGVEGAVRVLSDKIKNMTHQGIVGQFGLTKIFDTLEKAIEMFNALVGYTDPQTGEHVFGHMEKPTDNNESDNEHYEHYKDGSLFTNPKNAIEFLYKKIKTFGRLQRITHLMRVMYSNIDNSAGALNLEEVDVALPDGSYNTAIETDKNIRRLNGTARNRQYAFLYGEKDLFGKEEQKGFYDWLIDPSPGGGGFIYPKEKFWNEFLKQRFNMFLGHYRGMTPIPEVADLVEEWLTEKII